MNACGAATIKRQETGAMAQQSGEGGGGYDPVLERSIPWTENPYRVWNVTYTGAIKNHFALEGELLPNCFISRSTGVGL